jgi:hypothetical protein
VLITTSHVDSYALLATDTELIDEATVAVAHVCDDVVPPLVRNAGGALDVLRRHYVLVLGIHLLLLLLLLLLRMLLLLVVLF